MLIHKFVHSASESEELNDSVLTLLWVANHVMQTSILALLAVYFPTRGLCNTSLVDDRHVDVTCLCHGTPLISREIVDLVDINAIVAVRYNVIKPFLLWILSSNQGIDA